MTTLTTPIDFDVPERRWATSPPERRGSRRDQVKLMVAGRSTDTIAHTTFESLIDHLAPGDALVVNTSRTFPGAIAAVGDDGRPLRLHVASPSGEGFWMLEVRIPLPEGGTSPGPDAPPQALALRGGGVAHLMARSRRSRRLWIAAFEGIPDVMEHLAVHGEPIRYTGGAPLPLADYQTVFAGEAGSAEMPSAGRPFTADLVTRLVARGVVVLPIVLHTGVSSYEAGETPGDERFRVPPTTARVGNALRAAGGRVVAVGTTVVRALETVAEVDGTLHPGEGTTDVLVTPERGVRSVDGLLTGWHEPRSSHLRLLEAVAGSELLERCYAEALSAGYLWHEFGDELLILP